MVEASEKLQFETFEAFHDWALQHEARAEWVAGKLILLTNSQGESLVSVRRIHQKLQLFLSRLLVSWLEENSLGGEVLGPEFAVRLSSRPSGREPDVFYVNPAQLPLLNDTYLDTAPALCIEIVSPESADRDFNDKFQEYEAAGILEYWSVDPDDHAIFFYRLADNGRYRRILPQDGIYTSQAVPGLTLQTSWLWQDPLPTLREIGRFWEARESL